VKPVTNALWTLKDVVPNELIRSDILHTMILGNLQHLMEWIKGFLEFHNRLPAFDNIWSSLPPYPGNYMPHKSYRLFCQLSGKEMRSILMVILSVLTAALRRKTDTQRPTTSQEWEFKRAITCVRYLTDFALLSWYRSHTDSTIGYMQEYLQEFHCTKDVFLRYRATKATKGRADLVSKELTEWNKSRNVEPDAKGRRAAQRARAAEEDRDERAYLVNQVLVENSHFNFPKIHLIMHWADQISLYASLPQYSTEVCETSYKALKDAYRWSNHVDSIPQIIQGYTRSHSFAAKELDMAAWVREDPAIQQRLGDVVRPKRKETPLIVPAGTKIYVTLQGKGAVQVVYDLVLVAKEFMIPELGDHIVQFFACNVCQAANDPELDAERILLYATVQAYNSPEIPVPDQDVVDNNAYKLQHVQATRGKMWRGKEARRDAVWVRIESMRLHPTSVMGCLREYHGLVIAFLNALFILRGSNGELYKLAHVTLLEWAGNPMPHGSEGMSEVKEFLHGGGQKVV